MQIWYTDEKAMSRKNSGTKSIYERFLWFDQQVRAKRCPNATKLAAEFEISLKTAQRDIEFMRDRLNCPLFYDKTLKGYSYEDETFSLPSIYISSEELTALLITRKMLQGISAEYIGGELSLLIEKITSILKRHVTEEASIDDAVSIQLIGYAKPSEGIFKSVLEACLKKKGLSFDYYSPAKDEKTTRTIDPYHLFNYMGTWHLIGYCHLRQGLRDFNLSRITDAGILDETFSIRRSFNLREYFDSAFGLYKGGNREEVTLRFTPEKSKWIRDQIWHRDQEKKWLPDGSLELTFPVTNFAEIAMEVLKHGSGVEVVEPEGLRTLIRAEAEKVTRLYQEESSFSGKRMQQAR